MAKYYDEMKLPTLLAQLDKPKRDPAAVAELSRRLPALPMGADGKPDVELAQRFEAHVAALRSNRLEYSKPEYLGAKLVTIADWLRTPAVELVCEPYTLHPLDNGTDPETELTFPVADPVQMSQHAWLASHLPALTPNFACSDAEQVESLIEQVAGRKPLGRNTAVVLKRWKNATEQDRKRAERRLKPAVPEATEADQKPDDAPPPPPPGEVNTSSGGVLVVYAAEDQRHFKSLRLHMQAVKLIDYRGVRVGENTLDAQAAMLRQARIVVLLITPDLLSEMPVGSIMAQARAAGARIVPVLVRPVMFRHVVGDLSPLPANQKFVTQWPDTDLGWLDVARSLDRVLGAAQ